MLLYKSLFSYIASDWLCRLPAGEGKIALTFDDGPHEETTNFLLDTLHELHIPSTFFLTGEKCGNKKLLRLMSEEGHDLANHGFTHQSHLYFNSEKQKISIDRTHAAISLCGFTPVCLFRPPYGSYNLNTQHVLRSLNYRGVLWSVMIGDWKNSKPQILWSKLKTKIHDGAIIVLHDGHSTTKNLVPLLYLLVEEVQKRNWQFVKLSDELISVQEKSCRSSSDLF